MRSLLHGILLSGLFLFSGKTTLASTITADQSGNWTSASTWDLDAVPGCFDTIVIPAGITVTVNDMIDLTGCPPVYILVEGTLHFQTGKKMDLPDGSVVYMAPGGTLSGGGGSGNSNWITIDGEPYWTAGDGDVTGPAVLCQSCSLPVELMSFEATLNVDVVDITWTTASEIDNDYFLVQRSQDGFNWETIEQVDGANNSSIAIDYSAQDREPLMGLSYYRLKQVDNNGAFEYSDIRVVSNGNFFVSQQMLVLSSESGGQQNIVIYFSESVTGPTEIAVISMDGRIVATQTINLQDEKWVVLTIGQVLSSGIYAVKANKKIEKSFFY